MEVTVVSTLCMATHSVFVLLHTQCVCSFVVSHSLCFSSFPFTELRITDHIKPTEHHDRTFLTTRVVAVPRTGQGNTDRLRVNSDPCSSPALKSMLSRIPAQHHRVIHPKDAEWRRCLHTLSSLQGFRCKRAASLAAAEHPVAPSTARQLTAPIPSVGPDQVLAHQRVVKKIQVKDALEPTSTCFRHVIPMPAQHSVFTLDPCGTTQYGRLQFDWMRGHEEGELLKVCGKTKDQLRK